MFVYQTYSRKKEVEEEILESVKWNYKDKVEIHKLAREYSKVMHHQGEDGVMSTPRIMMNRNHWTKSNAMKNWIIN